VPKSSRKERNTRGKKLARKGGALKSPKDDLPLRTFREGGVASLPDGEKKGGALLASSKFKLERGMEWGRPGRGAKEGKRSSKPDTKESLPMMTPPGKKRKEFPPHEISQKTTKGGPIGSDPENLEEKKSNNHWPWSIDRKEGEVLQKSGAGAIRHGDSVRNLLDRGQDEGGNPYLSSCPPKEEEKGAHVLHKKVMWENRSDQGIAAAAKGKNCQRHKTRVFGQAEKKKSTGRPRRKDVIRGKKKHNNEGTRDNKGKKENQRGRHRRGKKRVIS